jgi:WD40 repeat protein
MGRDFRLAQRVVFCVGGLPWLGLSILAVLTLSSALLGQTSQGSQARVSLPTDWSHHHLVFSKPATAEQLKRVQKDPRYWQQLSRRSPAAELDGALTSELQSGSKTSHASKKHTKRDWSENMGMSATVGAGQYPGFVVGSSGSCSDFVVFNTSLAGSSGQASIIAYNNVYSGCGTTIPSVYWAYNTGGAISTSVTLSPDGTQLAFVQNQGGVATLVLLTWASSGGSAIAPITPTSETIGSYRGCTAPCMTTIALSGSPTDTYSAPFYDFSGSDTLYVGDDASYLHQFTGVFLGTTPQETTTTTVPGTPWPVLVGTAGTNLSGPIYDSTTGNVFVTTSYVYQPGSGTGSGGQLAAVCATSTCGTIGAVTLSGVLGPATGGTVCVSGTSGNGSTLRLDSPIVDPVAGMVYGFLGNDGNGNSAVIQLPMGFSSASCGTESKVGVGGSGVPLFAGTFDNLYFTSSGSSPSGNLYVCGNTSGAPTLYQVPITNNGIAASGNTVLAALSTGSSICSPVTEVYDGTNDWIFLSVESKSNTASPVNCPTTTGCLMNFSVPTTSGGALPTGTAVTPLWASGGSSGIVADTPAGSEIYYSALGTRTCKTSGTKGGCAVQASQSGLN